MTRAIGCLLLLVLPAVALGVEDAPAEFVGIRVGFADRYKAGVWMPVEVLLRGGSQRLAGEVRLTVPDGDGVPSRVVSLPDEPCVVLPGQTASYGLFVRFGRTNSALLAEFVVDGQVVARREFPSGDEAGPTRFLPAMPALQPLIVSVGAADAGIEDAVALRQADPTRERVVAHIDDFNQLPTRWFGYEGVEALVLSTSRPESFRDSAQLNRRLEALDRWVRHGGRLVLCVGAAGAEVLAPGGLLARFAPGEFAEMVPLRRLGAMESYAGGNAPIPILEGGLSLHSPRLTNVHGVIEAREADLPLVVRTARGFGQVLFVAADLDQPPLGGWKDRRLVMARLLDLPVARAEDKERDRSVLRYAYDDLSGQLRSALDQFQGVRLVPFGVVAAVLVLYIAVIGPGDYFFLKRVLRRMELTWVTFPATVLAVSVAAYGMAYWLKGTEIRMNQADVVDVDVATGHVRGTCWFNLYSPRIDAFDLSLAPQPPFELAQSASASGDGVLLGWLGLPGQSLGGMNSRTQGPALWTDAYAFAPQLNAVTGAPIPAWATKSFTARWEASAPDTITASLALADEAPTGVLTNALDVPLNDCLLAYGNWAYRLGDIAPGAAVSLSADSPRSELKTVLTGRRYVQEDKSLRQRITPYDRANVDPDYVVGAMLFHEAAGGTRFTDLSNAYQPFVDMSSLLKTGQAILVARIEREGKPRRAANVLRDGLAIAGPDDRAVSIYRFVIPVETRRKPASQSGR
ncbi:MAG: hypothetical protein U1E05_26705 [Patescibacteria group bacterium]|nr:hypothetical protein [Patescibacteria group bacterium]